MQGEVSPYAVRVFMLLLAAYITESFALANDESAKTDVVIIFIMMD